MKKELVKNLSFESNGVKITGKIVVTMNYTLHTKTVHNPVLHDEFERNVFLHKVELYKNGNLLYYRDKIADENTVLSVIKEYEAIFKLHAKDACKPKVDGFDDKMKKMGFSDS